MSSEVDSTLRIFLSYSHIDRHLAGNIKTALENIWLSVFLAHEDIKPSLEWQETIYRELKECDIFIPIISENFKKIQNRQIKNLESLTDSRKSLSQSV